MRDLFFVQTLPSELEPMSDGERMFFTRHRARGDLKTAAGRVLMPNTTLDAAGEEFLGIAITVIYAKEEA